MNGDLQISFTAKSRLDRIIEKYSNENSPTVIESYNSGDLTEEKLLDIVRTLEINGYPKRLVFDLPLEFVLQIDSIEGGHANI